MRKEEEYDEEIPSLRRAIMIEKWMEDRSTTPSTTKYLKNSNGSTSSDSSCCGTIFSSSDTESGFRSTPKSPSLLTMQMPKREGKFMRTTKSRALKIYRELKKVKQPISPGGRIAGLLNSIFSSKNLKKPKFNDDIVDLSSVGKSRSLKDLTTSSSASSFSRTCLTKTPSSRCKLNNSNSNGLKRSVRFCPVSVIVDEDCRPCGHKNIYEEDPRVLSFSIVKNHLLEKKYTAGTGDSSRFRVFHKDNYVDDDIESCSSSDLFELDNIGAVGIGLYTEELPVYGTTNLKTSQAIAKRFIL